MVADGITATSVRVVGFVAFPKKATLKFKSFLTPVSLKEQPRRRLGVRFYIGMVLLGSIPRAGVI